MDLLFKVLKGSASGEIMETTITHPALSRGEVLVKVSHSGVCSTDAHVRHQDMALGHKGVDLMFPTGTFTIHLRGDGVIVCAGGLVTDSCGTCPPCHQSRCSVCQIPNGPTMYGNGTFDPGAFSSGVVLREPYFFRISDALTSENAALLMCAGITVWRPLILYGAKGTDCVGIIGIGGLGHLAVQFAAKLGCEVLAFSGINEKKDNALSFRASHFIATKNTNSFSLLHKLNHLIITAGSMPDWKLFMPIMESGCIIYPLLLVGPKTVLEVHHMLFLYSSVRLVYTQGPTSEGYKEILEFAARHRIQQVREVRDEQGVEESLKRLGEGKVRDTGEFYL